MPGKSIVMAVVLSGWLIAAVLAFLVVAYTSFFGIGVIGILLWFICTQVELEEEGPVATGSTASLLAPQIRARQRDVARTARRAAP